MKLKPTPILLALSLLFAACGDDDSTDASVADAASGEDAPTDSSGDAPISTDGGMVDAGTDTGPEPCSGEGTMRPAVCGNCGMGQELCEGGVWVLQDLCINERECAAGASERMATPMCGELARICSATCEWASSAK